MPRRHTRQSLRSAVLFAIAAFALARIAGPTLVVIRDDSLEPLLRTGDVIWAGRARGRIDAGTVGLVRTPQPGRDGVLRRLYASVSGLVRRNQDNPGTANGRPIERYATRLVVADGGDNVTWTDRTIAVRNQDGSSQTFALAPLHEDLRQPERSLRLLDDEVFLVSTLPGSNDGRSIGPQSRRAVRYTARRIVWPRERATRLEAPASTSALEDS